MGKISVLSDVIVSLDFKNAMCEKAFETLSSHGFSFILSDATLTELLSEKHSRTGVSVNAIQHGMPVANTDSMSYLRNYYGVRTPGVPCSIGVVGELVEEVSRGAGISGSSAWLIAEACLLDCEFLLTTDERLLRVNMSRINLVLRNNLSSVGKLVSVVSPVDVENIFQSLSARNPILNK